MEQEELAQRRIDAYVAEEKRRLRRLEVSSREQMVFLHRHMVDPEDRLATAAAPEVGLPPSADQEAVGSSSEPRQAADAGEASAAAIPTQSTATSEGIAEGAKATQDGGAAKQRQPEGEEQKARSKKKFPPAPVVTSANKLKPAPPKSPIRSSLVLQAPPSPARPNPADESETRARFTLSLIHI